MDLQTGKAVVYFLLISVVFSGSCQSSESSDLVPATQIPNPTSPPTPSTIPTSTATPWPSRIPQDRSNCPVGGWTLFTEEDGLIGSAIETIATGSDGVIWAADYYGSVNWMYNGDWFTLPVDPIPAINVILPLETGGLWVGTQGGKVSLITGYDQLWTSRVIPMEKGGTAVYDLAISPQGHLWAATWDGLYELWGDDWVRIPKPVPDNVQLYSPKSLYFDQQAGLWVGARHAFNYYFQGGWSGLAAGIPELINVEDIEKDNVGNLWFGSLTGAFVYDGETWEKVYPGDDVPAGISQIGSLALDHEGRMWLVSSQETVLNEDGSWQLVIPDVGSADISIRSVEVDPFGALWFVSTEGVLCYLP